jgi:hypothetical protein
VARIGVRSVCIVWVVNLNNRWYLADRRVDGNRSQWPRGLRRGSAAALLAGIVGSNPAGGIDDCCECCVLSGRGLCVGPITRPEESDKVRCL